MSQSMLPVKSRKSHGIFCLCEWTTEYKLRPLVRMALHMPLNTCIWSTTPLSLTTAPSSHIAQYCSVSWLTGTGFYGLPPPAQLSCHSQERAACLGMSWKQQNAPFSVLVGRTVPYTKILEKQLITMIFFSISVTKTECWHSGTFYHIKTLHLPW